MFLIKKNTPVTVVRPTGEEVDHVTRKDNMFDKHEVVADPLFILAPSVGDLFGFECEETGFTLYVDQVDVKYLS